MNAESTSPALVARPLDAPVGHRERPILFSGPMVRAILDGRKTQTRRVVKPQPSMEWAGPIRCEFYAPLMTDKNGDDYPGAEVFGFANADEGRVCPYGAPGDRLWVRETLNNEDGDWVYAADGNLVVRAEAYPSAWASKGYVPSIHMPRWASRIMLEIIGVRVERLQSMNYYDWVGDFCPNAREREDALASFVGSDNQQRMAAEFWDSINGKRAPWSSNPWVWVVQFSKVPNPKSDRRGEK